jgi:hypothetical protein
MIGSAAMNAENFEAVETLRSGLTVKVRAIRPADKVRLTEAFSRFEADVLPQNKAMLAVFSRSGLPMQQAFADGIIHVTLSLAERPQRKTL